MPPQLAPPPAPAPPPRPPWPGRSASRGASPSWPERLLDRRQAPAPAFGGGRGATPRLPGQTRGLRPQHRAGARPARLSIDDKTVAPDGPLREPDVNYQNRVLSNFQASQGRQGPFDGRWTVSGSAGDMFVLQLTDPGEGGRIEGAWRDVRRAGGGRSGLIDPIGHRDGDMVVVRFVEADGAQPVEVRLRSPPARRLAGRGGRPPKADVRASSCTARAGWRLKPWPRRMSCSRHRRGRHGRRLTEPPHGGRPGRVVTPPPNDMDMQLRSHIPEAANIQLLDRPTPRARSQFDEALEEVVGEVDIEEVALDGRRRRRAQLDDGEDNREEEDAIARTASPARTISSISNARSALVSCSSSVRPGRRGISTIHG